MTDFLLGGVTQTNVNFQNEDSHAHANFNACQSNCVLTMKTLASGLVLCLKPAITLFERATPCSIYHVCGVYTNQISRNLMNSVDSSKNVLFFFFFESKHFKMANFMLGGANTSQCEMSQMVVTISPPKIMNIGQTLWF